LFALGSYWEITEVARIFGPLYSTVEVCAAILTKQAL
jgi:hypothetical protein